MKLVGLEDLTDDCKRFLKYLISNGGGVNGQGMPINDSLLSICSKNLGLSIQRLNEIISYVKDYGYASIPTFGSTGSHIPAPSGSDIQTFLKITSQGLEFLKPEKPFEQSLNITNQQGQVNWGNKDSVMNHETNINQSEKKGIKSKIIESLKTIPIISWLIKTVTGN